MATVVTAKNLVELVTTGKVEQDPNLPQTTRAKIAIKRNGVVTPAPESKAEPKAEPAKTPEPEAKVDAPKLDDSKKLDDTQKGTVKETRADPSAKPKAEEPSEDDLPERARKVIGKKHREMKEATEFAELQRKLRLDAEKRVKELEAELAGKGKPKPEDPKPTRAAGEEPKPEDFPNVAAYARAFAVWDREQADTEKARKQSEAEETTRQSKASETWATRLAAVEEEIPDFHHVVSEAFAREKDVAKSVLESIQDSELGPHLLYHLAMNAKDRATFMSLNAERAIKFLGRLEATIEAERAKPKAEEAPKEQPKPKEEPKPKVEPPAKNVSKAPPPADTSVGAGEPIVKDPADMTTQEYLAYRKSQRKAQAR
jgi:hypothetical protein